LNFSFFVGQTSNCTGNDGGEIVLVDVFSIRKLYERTLIFIIILVVE